jgi:hypothetical protein
MDEDSAVCDKHGPVTQLVMSNLPVFNPMPMLSNDCAEGGEDLAP